MEIEFIRPRVFAGKRYHGEITRFKLNSERTALFIFVRLDNEPSMEFMKRFDADISIQSRLFDFCQDMQIFTGERTADLKELEGRRVIVRLTRYNGKLYVDKIWLDEAYYSSDEEEEDDEEDE